MKLRTGRRNHRNLYLQQGDQPDESDPCLGLVMHPAVAAVIVDCVNKYPGQVFSGPERVQNALINCMPGPPDDCVGTVPAAYRRDMSLPQTCLNEAGEIVEPTACTLAEPHYATRMPDD